MTRKKLLLYDVIGLTLGSVVTCFIIPYPIWMSYNFGIFAGWFTCRFIVRDRSNGTT